MSPFARLVGVDGTCDSRFSAVRDAFAANFESGLEAGAACAVVADGDVVVDLWGGTADPDTGRPWQARHAGRLSLRDKGPTALCLALLVDRGLVDLDTAIKRYWPELRVDATVRHALTHQAGIPIVDDLAPGSILDIEAPSCVASPADKVLFVVGITAHSHDARSGRR
jgi:CubicO group peptidase (beta-lactamase class C family)